jgi:hypothetical protein
VADAIAPILCGQRRLLVLHFGARVGRPCSSRRLERC